MTYFDKREEITPDISVKNRLDKAWEEKHRKHSIFTTQIPFYQATAAAVVFLLIGCSISFLRPAHIETVYKTIETIQYVDRPVKEIEYVEIPIIRYVTKQERRQDEIAMHNLNHILNEEQGISIADDTLIQKMQITIY